MQVLAVKTSDQEGGTGVNTTENFDVQKIAAFRKLVDEAVGYAQTHNLPIQIVEGAMRDVLSGVEASRLLKSLRMNGGKL